MKKYLEYKEKSEKVTIKINTERQMAMPNILYAAKSFCKPYELFVVIDGDDYLLGNQVFKLFNAVFSENDSWVAYSNFLTVNGRIGYSRPYP